MTRARRVLTFPMLLAALSAPWLGACHASPPSSARDVDVCDVDLERPEAIRKATFGLQREREHVVKSGLEAAASLRVLAAAVEADLLVACSGLVNDLGGTEQVFDADVGPSERLAKTCAAAVNAADAARRGVKGFLKLDILPPYCGVSPAEMARCVAACDPGRVQGEARCEGGVTSGRCDGACSGDCRGDVSGVCAGVCHSMCVGACDGELEGSCGGDFEGTCNGACSGSCSQPMVGDRCPGTCRGRCEGLAKGTCKGDGDGTCKGRCLGICAGACLVREARCAGRCVGTCSLPFVDPLCSWQPQLHGATPSCAASCFALALAHASCVPAKTRVRGEKASSLAFARAVERHHAGILKVAMGLNAQLEVVSADVRSAVERAQALAKVSDPATTKRLLACVTAAGKMAADADSRLRRARLTFRTHPPDHGSGEGMTAPDVLERGEASIRGR